MADTFPLVKSTRAQERTRSEILMRAIANENLSVVKKILKEGAVVPAKYDGGDTEDFITRHFNLEIANCLVSAKKKWNYGKLSGLLHSPPPLEKTSQWVSFVLRVSSPQALKGIYTSLLGRWDQTTAVEMCAALCEGLSEHPDAIQWMTDIGKSPATRNHALSTIVRLQAHKTWDRTQSLWNASDFIRLAETLTSGPPLTAEQARFVTTHIAATHSEAWSQSQKQLKRNHTSFENFYKKTFGAYASLEEFMAHHDPQRWVRLPASLNLQPFTTLGLPWWRAVQIQSRAVVKATLGGDAPSKSPRSFEHAVLWNLPMKPQGFGKDYTDQLKTPFDAIALVSRPPAVVKKFLAAFPHFHQWKDEHNNTLGHYIVAFNRLNKSLIEGLIKEHGAWFETQNANGLDPVGVFATLHPNNLETKALMSNRLLTNSLKNTGAKPRRRKI